MSKQTYSKNNLPVGDWQIYKKKVNTKMIRIDGPFTVETSEGDLSCEEGWLAIDARGYPYPLADKEKQLIYEKVEDDGISAETGA